MIFKLVASKEWLVGSIFILQGRPYSPLAINHYSIVNEKVIDLEYILSIT